MTMPFVKFQNTRVPKELKAYLHLQPLRWRCDVREEQHPYTVYVARTSSNRVIAAHDLYCCLLPQCDFAYMPLGLSDHNNNLKGKALNKSGHAFSAGYL